MNNSSSDYLDVVAYHFATAKKIKPNPRFDLSSRTVITGLPLTSSSESKSVESTSLQSDFQAYFELFSGMTLSRHLGS